MTDNVDLNKVAEMQSKALDLCSESMNIAIELTELVTDSEKEYYNKAVWDKYQSAMKELDDVCRAIWAKKVAEC